VDETLRRLLLGRLRAGQLPDLLDLSILQADLGRLVQNSLGVAPPCPVPLPPGPVQRNEWGACIVLEGDTVRFHHLCDGTPTGVVPPPECQADGHQPPTYAGYAHTHPPDDDGVPYPVFSADDFRSTLADTDNLALVCNGIEVFALVRTADQTQPRREADQAELAAWDGVYVAAAGRALSEAQAGTEDVALWDGLWQANREMCRRLGFALYYGDWGRPLALVHRP
jgi:hypothetical protein